MAATWEELRESVRPGRAQSPTRLLTMDQAREARRLFTTGLMTNAMLARKYELPSGAMSALLRGKTYREHPDAFATYRPRILHADRPMRAIGEGRRCTYPFTPCTCGTEPVIVDCVAAD